MLRISKKPSTKAHVCNSSTFETEAGKLLSSRPSVIQPVKNQTKLINSMPYLQ